MLLTAVFPAFVVIFLGWIAGRSGLMRDGASAALNHFVFYFALPAMMFRAIAATDFHAVLDPVLIGLWVGVQILLILGTMLVCRAFFGRSGLQSLVSGLTAVFSNTGYMGIPLAVAAFGEAALLPSVVVTVAQTALLIPACLIIMDVMKARHAPGGSASAAIKKAMRGILVNPIILAAVGGLIISGTGLEQPLALQKLTEMLAPAAGPCALFAIGLFLAGQKLGHGVTEVGFLSTVKLVIHPAIIMLSVGVLAGLGLAPDPISQQVLIVMAALPAGATAFVVAQVHQTSVERSSGTILVTTLISVLTVSLCLVWVSDHF